MVKRKKHEHYDTVYENSSLDEYTRQDKIDVSPMIGPMYEYWIEYNNKHFQGDVDGRNW